VTWDGDEHSGTGWHIDLLLYDDADMDSEVQRLTAFLRRWGVPDGSLSFRIVPGSEEAGREQRRIIVPDREGLPSTRCTGS
jgi:hypothetical protein